MSGIASSDRNGITRELAAFAVRCRFEDLPGEVIHQTIRGFLHWLGCACGGSRDAMVSIALDAVAEVGAAPQASVIGRDVRVDVGSAAFVNCLASSLGASGQVHAFDDRRMRAGPAAAAVLAWSEHGRQVSGRDFIAALATGLEIECRLNDVLLAPQAGTHPGFVLAGLTGPVGAAAALGRLMNLDEAHMTWAIGLGASQAGGFRCADNAMPAAFSSAQAARSGVNAASLAAKGYTNLDTALEAPAGFLDVYSSGANAALAMDGLGQRYAMVADDAHAWPDEALDAWFDRQASLVLPARASARLRVACRAMLELSDVGREIASHARQTS